MPVENVVSTLSSMGTEIRIKAASLRLCSIELVFSAILREYSLDSVFLFSGTNTERVPLFPLFNKLLSQDLVYLRPHDITSSESKEE
jgi:hypothetical protein